MVYSSLFTEVYRLHSISMNGRMDSHLPHCKPWSHSRMVILLTILSTTSMAIEHSGMGTVISRTLTRGWSMWHGQSCRMGTFHCYGELSTTPILYMWYVHVHFHFSVTDAFFRNVKECLSHCGSATSSLTTYLLQQVLARKKNAQNWPLGHCCSWWL